MTPKAAQEACRKFAAEIGPQAEITVFIATYLGSDPVRLAVRPFHYPNESLRFSVEGETFAEVIAKARAEWAKLAAEHEGSIVRKMALAIIDKADGGQVTATALMDAFSAGEVAKHGDAACAEATRLAGNAPFSIIRDGAPALIVA